MLKHLARLLRGPRPQPPDAYDHPAILRMDRRMRDDLPGPFGQRDDGIS